ncbi:hypothetical protein AB6A40_008565 [Gnathostoma spinigerum]|uniref:Uncharacterized protein n=1 Tax=Gnathostoma spinigerum TaxID=75299 RepID=A0ABD6ERB8_9BILA
MVNCNELSDLSFSTSQENSLKSQSSLMIVSYLARLVLLLQELDPSKANKLAEIADKQRELGEDLLSSPYS